LPTLKSKYVDAGKVYYIFREYTKHPQLDVPVFLLAHCVEKGKYYDVIQGMFDNQNDLFKAPDLNGSFRLILSKIAKASGLRRRAAFGCVTNAAAAARLTTRISREAKPFNVSDAPTFVLNGTKLPSDAPFNLAEVDAVLTRQAAKPG
jgi:protein-disulfide isomerase